MRQVYPASTASAARPRLARRPSLRALLLRVATVVAVLLTFAYFAVGAYVAATLTRTDRRPQTASPADYRLPFETVQVPSRDGLALSGWFVPAQGSTRAVLLVHGKGSNRSREFDDRFLDFAARLHTAGYTILTIDLRGHGDSQGDRFTLGDHERRDVLGAVDWLVQRGYTHIGAVGVSMGSAAVVKAAVDPRGGDRLQALVLDSAIADFGDILVREFPAASNLPGWFLPGSLIMARALYQADLNGIRPAEDLPQIKAPVFLIFGAQDKTVPVAQFHANRAARPDAETWLLPDIGHADIFGAHPDEYTARVLRFFERTLR